MSQKQLIISVVAVVVVLAGLWFIWQRRSGSSEEAALNQQIEAEVEVLDADMTDLESRLPK